MKIPNPHMSPIDRLAACVLYNFYLATQYSPLLPCPAADERHRHVVCPPGTIRDVSGADARPNPSHMAAHLIHLTTLKMFHLRPRFLHPNCSPMTFGTERKKCKTEIFTDCSHVFSEDVINFQRFSCNQFWWPQNYLRESSASMSTFAQLPSCVIFRAVNGL